MLVHDVKKASAEKLAGVKAFSYLHSVDGKSITTAKELCRHLLEAEASGNRVDFVTRQTDWEYRSQTRYRSHKVGVSNVRLVGPRAPMNCN